MQFLAVHFDPILPFACRPSWRENKATEENWLVVTIFVSYEMSFPDLNFFRHQT